MKVNLKKCKFHTDRVEFLGYEVSPIGVNMLPDRIKVIDDWAIPKTVKEVQSFLGFCNFYRSFIALYSEFAAPLTDLTKKDRIWSWTEREQFAFDYLKRQFVTADIVRHFDAKLPIVLETDASDFAISGVLSQVHPDGVHPVGYYSRKLQVAELNYDTHDKELLAIIESLRAWRHFTMETPTPVRIITDHNNLQYFMTTKVLNRRQVRWAQFLADFNFTLEHRPGRLNTIPDLISRRVQDELGIGDRLHQNACLLPPSLFAAIAKYDDPVLPHKQLDDAIRQAYKNDTYYNDTIRWLQQDVTTRAKLPPNTGRVNYYDGDDDGDSSDNGFYLDTDTDLLYYEGRLYVPESVRLTIMTARHDSAIAGHPGVCWTFKL